MIRLTLYLCLALAGVWYWADGLPGPARIVADTVEPEGAVAVTKAVADSAEVPEVAPQPVAAILQTRRGKPLLQISRRDKPLAPEALLASGAELHVVTGWSVNLRSGPSVRNGVTGTVRRGDLVAVLNRSGNGWAQVQLAADGQQGYMAAKFLAPAQ